LPLFNNLVDNGQKTERFHNKYYLLLVTKIIRTVKLKYFGNIQFITFKQIVYTIIPVLLGLTVSSIVLVRICVYVWNLIFV